MWGVGWALLCMFWCIRDSDRISEKAVNPLFRCSGHLSNRKQVTYLLQSVMPGDSIPHHCYSAETSPSWHPQTVIEKCESLHYSGLLKVSLHIFDFESQFGFAFLNPNISCFAVATFAVTLYMYWRTPRPLSIQLYRILVINSIKQQKQILNNVELQRIGGETDTSYRLCRGYRWLSSWEKWFRW